MDWEFKDLENMKWNSKSSAIKGPKRMCKFCILAIVVPIVLLCIPLYMRYQALRPHLFTLSPSDMKLLNHVRTANFHLCNYFRLHMYLLTFLYTGMCIVYKCVTHPTPVSQYLTIENVFVCVKSEEYGFLVTLRPISAELLVLLRNDEFD